MGTVADTTGAVLPGVTVSAVHEATGNTFEVVTDATGSFRLPVRVGSYRVIYGLPLRCKVYPHAMTNSVALIYPACWWSVRSWP